MCPVALQAPRHQLLWKVASEMTPSGQQGVLSALVALSPQRTVQQFPLHVWPLGPMFSVVPE